MWGKGAAQGNNFVVVFLSVLGVFLKLFWNPKLVQNLLIFGSNFGSLFFGFLELFGCLLGAFLGLLRISWEASGPKNLEKHMVF